MKHTQSPSPIERLHVPAPTPAKSKDYISPSQADEAGMRKWKDDMLSGHPSGCATSLEQWGNSYVTQFKTIIDTMTQSLRIKEDTYGNMFSELAKMVRETKESLENSQCLVDEANVRADKNDDSFTLLISSDCAERKLEAENKFLKEKLKVSAQKLSKEEESNTNLFMTVKMAKETVFTDRASATNEEKEQFLSETNCMELLDPVDLKGETTYIMDNQLKTVLLYGPEGVMFVKTDNPCTVAMQMCMYSDSWDNLNLEELKEKQERNRTTSGSSSTSQTDSQALIVSVPEHELKDW